MWWSCTLTFGVLLVGWPFSDGARILGIFDFNGKSQFSMLESLMKGLAAKGHDVVVVSHFPQKNKIANYTDISLKGSLPEIVNGFTVDFVRNFRYHNLMELIWDMNTVNCRTALGHPLMKEMMKKNNTFDIIVSGFFGGDCWLALAHKWKIPTILVLSTSSSPWINARLMNPDNPSYIPNYFLAYTPQMSFRQRVINTVFHMLTTWGQYYKSEVPINRVLQEHFGDDVPPLSELKRNTSLVLVNSHFSIHGPRPTVPGYVEVAGLHIGTPKQLPQDLDIFLNESSNGVIYFSFGSLIRGDSLPEEKLQAFVDVFRALPQRVLWKIDGSLVKNLPSNVKTSTWLPQLDVLAHPNVRVFISHGGLMGSLESIYSGVPVLGIPMFFDQIQNVEYLAHIGMAKKVDYDDISYEALYTGLKSLLDDSSYKNAARRISVLFRDRPQSALETAIFWTEYVIRHGGTAHLRSAAVDLPLYQYLLLDVLVVLLLTLVMGYLTLRFLLKTAIALTSASLRKLTEDSEKKHS